MRYLWMTDIHLDQQPSNKRLAFYREIAQLAPHGIIISGDIAKGKITFTVLREMAQHSACPIYFVMGNHDYYDSPIAITRAKLREFCDEQLIWLNDHQGVSLSDKTIVIGVDGWADTRYGNFSESNYRCPDFSEIPDFISAMAHGKKAAGQLMQQLADQDAKRCQWQMTKALESGYQELIIVTHVPPFIEASWYKGAANDEHALPYFSNRVLGELIRKNSNQYPNKIFRVLCGHTHYAREVALTPNLLVQVGQPRSIGKMIDIKA